MWIVWPREGDSVDFIWTLGKNITDAPKTAMSEQNRNWHMKWED